MSKETILSNARTNLQNSTKITAWDPDSVTRIIAEAAAEELADLETKEDVSYNESFITTATGYNIDKIGHLGGIYRRNATTARDQTFENVRFYIDPSYILSATQLATTMERYATEKGISSNNLLANGFIIPAGTYLYVGNSAKYQTMADAEMTDQETEVYVQVVAVGPGPDYNVTQGELNQHKLSTDDPVFTPIQKILILENKHEIMSGLATETDANLKYKVINAPLSAASANETAVRIALTSIPGVSDVVLLPMIHGVGTFHAYIISTTPITPPALITYADAVVNTVVSYGTKPYVTAPDYIGVEIVLTLLFKDYSVSPAEQDSIRNSVRTKVIQYVNNIPIGGELIINELRERVMATSPQIYDMRLEQVALGEYDTDDRVNNRVRAVILENISFLYDEKAYTNNNMTVIC